MKITNVLFLLVSFGTSALFAQIPAPEALRGIDRDFNSIAVKHPGFAGYFFDQSGSLVIVSTPPSDPDALTQEVTSHLRERLTGSVVNRSAQFGFLQLNAWRALLKSSRAREEIQYVDVDEVANVVSIGVTTESARDRVKAVVEQLAIPPGAVKVDIVSPARFVSQALSDLVRPLVGGLEILSDRGQACTLGVNVYYNNPSIAVWGRAGFLTASHCSSTQWSSDGTAFYQGGVSVGSELWDPPGFTSQQNAACPPGEYCRWSEAAFVAYQAGVDWSLARIAQTTYRSFSPAQDGSTTINDYTPTFTIDYVGPVLAGSSLDKIGKTTGWASGTVSQTCVDWRVANSWYFPCQDRLDIRVAQGDSGGPVFELTSANGVSFAGIAFADTGTGGVIFSSVARIADDFGTAITYR